MLSTATHNTDNMASSPSGEKFSHVHKKGELGAVLAQGHKKKVIGSAHLQPSMPGVNISPEATFTFHSDTHTPADSHAHSAHADSHVVHEPAAGVHEHPESGHLVKEEPKKGFFARMKGKIKGWFSKKKENEVSHPPLVGSEVVNVGNKKFEVRQGKWYNKIFSNTIGRISGVLTHALLTLRPQDGLKNPDIGKIKDILARYTDVNWDTDHTIYLGHTDRWDQVKKMFKTRKGFMNTISNIFWTPMIIGEGISANLSRADHYNSITKSLSIYSPNKWITAHEMGHAADFAQKWDFREYEKRILPFFGQLYTEKVASTNAVARTYNAEEKKEAEKVLYPAYGSYVGGGIGAGIASVLAYLGFKQGSVKAKHWFDKFTKVFLPIFPLAGIVLGHINARLPDSMKFKLFDKKNDPTSGDSTSSHDAHHVPVPVVPDPTVIALQEKLVKQEQENKELKEKLTQASEGSHKEKGTHEHTKEATVEKKHEEHPKEEPPKDHKEDHAGVDAMKKDADIVRDKLTKVLPKDYEISWDEVSTGKFKGMQKITALHKDKEKKHDPEVIITVYEPGKVRVRYNPQKDHGSIKDLHYSYYLGETTIDALDTCLSAVAGVISPGDGKKPDFHILEAVGLKKEGEDATKHGYEEGEGPFGKNDQNKDHHKKEREEKGADHKDEKKEDDHHKKEHTDEKKKDEHHH